MFRLDMKDAVYHFGRDHGGSTDQFALLAFDHVDGVSPTFAAVQAHVESRSPRVPSLGLRLKETLWGLDYPRWVRDASSSCERVTDHDLGQPSWADVERFLGELLGSRLDMREQSWHLHVIRGVRDVPLVDGVATVVVLQVGHALTDGVGATRLLRALFAPPSDTVTIESPLPGHTRHEGAVRSWARSARSLLMAPVDLARSRVEAIRAVRDHTGGPAVASSPAGPLNGIVSSRRAVRVVPIPADDVCAESSTVTVSALAAVGTSLDAHLERVEGTDRGTRPSVAAFVPMALPADLDWPSANRVVVGTVDLHAESDRLDERLDLIAQSLADERARLTSASLLRVVRADERVPAPIVRFVQGRRFRQRDRSPQRVGAQTTVVSVNRGAANLELCGAVARFTAGFPFLADGRCLNHGIFGLGDTVAVSMVACPDAMPDLDAYTEGLVNRLRRNSSRS